MKGSRTCPALSDPFSSSFGFVLKPGVLELAIFHTHTIYLKSPFWRPLVYHNPPRNDLVLIPRSKNVGQGGSRLKDLMSNGFSHICTRIILLLWRILTHQPWKLTNAEAMPAHKEKTGCCLRSDKHRMVLSKLIGSWFTMLAIVSLVDRRF